MVDRIADKIIEKIRSSLTGEREVDRSILEFYAERYKDSVYSAQVLKETNRHLARLKSEEESTAGMELTVDDITAFDESLDQVKELIKKKEYPAAQIRMVELFSKYGSYFQEDDDSRYLYFNNILESTLFELFFAKEDEKEIRPCPFNFPELYFMFAFVLIENGNYSYAEMTLNEALKWNPVDNVALSELCEVYKATKRPDLFFNANKTMHGVAYDKEALAQCFRNYGYYFSEIEDYDAAISMYLFSRSFADSDKIDQELEYILKNSKKKISAKKFTPEYVEKMFRSRGIVMGPEDDVIAVCLGLAKTEMEASRYQMAFELLNVAYEITEDDSIKEMMEEARKQVKDPEMEGGDLKK